MFICLCRGVSDTKIISAIHEGCVTVKEIRECTGAASQCCKCLPDIRQLLLDHHAIDNIELIAISCC